MSSRSSSPEFRHPQDRIDEFWSQFSSKTSGKAMSIIPRKWYSKKTTHRKQVSPAAQGSQPAYASYDAAAAQCRAKVDHIVQECRRTNQKYRDPHFDLESDCQRGIDDCLNCLDNAVPVEEDDTSDAESESSSSSPSPPSPRPRAVKRVADIFDKPEFFIDGPTANDVRQGLDGDCWLMAALCTMSNKAGLVERVCVARDEAVGVYGFVFHRDGEWISEVIDDKLYLKRPDYEESRTERTLFEDRLRANSEEAYRKLYQSNSGALFFAQCENPNETWLPLLEKAYAKAHGDYGAIEGGYTGEGIEDLTGGVTTEIYTTDILDKEHFWTHEIMRVNETFLFGCSTGIWGRGRAVRDGIYALHAYSVMRAVEIDGVRLVLLRNPWGFDEWKGPWSDGSKEWTADWIAKLGHRFGDDGAFWISYEDLLRKYQAFDRTRLFDGSWRLASAWTTMAVPWTLTYNDCRFAFSLGRAATVVLVLGQLDDRYFRGLEGQYRFALGFRVHRVGQVGQVGQADGDSDDDTADYVVRTQDSYSMTRSASVEIELEAGSYQVLVKIVAERAEDLLPPEAVVRANAKTRRDKLIRIGRAYDLAHSKGAVAETAEEKEARRAAAKRHEAREKAQIKKQIMEERQLEHLKRKHALRARRKERAKQAAKRAAKAEEEKAKEEKKEEEKEEAKEETEKAEKEAEKVKEETEKSENSQVKDDKKDDKDDDKDDDNSKESHPKESHPKESHPKESHPKESTPKESVRGRSRSQKNRSTQSSPRRPYSQDSDLDSISSLSEVSDDELEIHYRVLKQAEREVSEIRQAVPQGRQEQAAQGPPEPTAQKEEKPDPWNAVAVVNLRVYYQSVEGDEEVVKLWVERPKPAESEEDSEEDKETVTKEEVPDVDDSLRDATAKLHIG